MAALKSLLAAALLLAACGHDDGFEFGPPTGSVCPPEGTTLTYTSFAVPFMDAYCNDCHSSELTGEDRQGAPLYHDFDYLGGIRAVADHVDWTAAAGPDATNELMPPADFDAIPTLAERRQLGEWIACGLPE